MARGKKNQKKNKDYGFNSDDDNKYDLKFDDDNFNSTSNTMATGFDLLALNDDDGDDEEEEVVIAPKKNNKKNKKNKKKQWI